MLRRELALETLAGERGWDERRIAQEVEQFRLEASQEGMNVGVGS